MSGDLTVADRPGSFDGVIEIRASVHRLAKDILRPAALKLDPLNPKDVIQDGSSLWEVFEQWYELGYHTMFKDLDPGFGQMASNAVLFELGWGAADLAVSLGVSGMPFQVVEMLTAFTGDTNLRDEIVTPFLEDKTGRVIGCWAITEPMHGSDLLAVGSTNFDTPATAGACRARKDGSDWIINGQKSAWVSNGTIASHALLFLNVDPDHGAAGGAVAVVPLNLPGVSKGAPLDKLGQRALNQGEIFFDDVRIPERYMVIGPELYSMVLSMVLGTANSGMGSIFAGLARASFDEALQYALEREQGGRPISQHQLVQGKLFDMFMKAEQARAQSELTTRVALEQGMPSLPHAIASKVTSTRAAFEVSSDAIQVFGGVGLAKGVAIEKFFRDARASLIEDGVNELLMLVGAQHLLQQAK
ncbi:MAG: acyl-CoA/acyl-ACP dehydrogenase [Acidimicrobiales bacterium]|nr:acyl-CoA/acyl-ACP dehydrogenase [Acidimicrobiales bacterium]